MNPTEPEESRDEDFQSPIAERHLSRAQQLRYGIMMMLGWVTIGTVMLYSSFSENNLPLYALASTSGLFLISLETDTAEAFLQPVLDAIPDSYQVVFAFGLIGTISSMWILIALLPMFGNWRGRSWLLLLLQNSYAAIQALAYPIYDHFS